MTKLHEFNIALFSCLVDKKFPRSFSFRKQKVYFPYPVVYGSNENHVKYMAEYELGQS